MAKVFDLVGYKPHAMQRRVHLAGSKHRFRVVPAGRRTGKSTLGGHEWTVDAFDAFYNRKNLDRNGTRYEHWIVGPEYSDAEKEFRVLYNDLEKLGVEFDRPGTYYNVEGGNLHISLFDGRFQVHGKSAKDPERLVGEGVRKVILAEAAKLKPSVWYKYLRPTLSDWSRMGQGTALMTSTPEGKNWYYDEYMRGLDPNQPEYWSQRMPSWANSYLYPLGENDPEILSLKNGMNSETFNQEIAADFSEFAGRVFKDFDEELHVGSHPYNPRWPLAVATDYGYTNPTVLLFVQWDNWDNVWVCGEYYERNRTIEEVIDDVESSYHLRHLMEKATLLYPDPEDPGSSASLSRKFRLATQGGTGGLISNRIDLMRTWLKIKPDGNPKMSFDVSCTNLINEMGQYRYPEKTRVSEKRNDLENPLKKDDHAPEALGRFFAGKYSNKLARRGATQSQAVIPASHRR